MLRLLILGGLAAGAFFAWKKFASPREEDELAEDLYGSATIHEQSDTPATTPA
jgi:hypothetical protein